MPTISVRIIRKPRKQRFCSECIFPIHGETIDLYGMAHYGEKPFHIYLHRECIRSEEVNRMIRDAEQCVHPLNGGGQDDAQDTEPATEIETGNQDETDVAPQSVGG